MPSLQDQAEAIANQYLAGIPPTYDGRYSEIAEPAVVQTLLKAFSSGLKPEKAALAAGLHPRTVQRWMERAEAEPDSAFASFATALKSAREQGMLRRLEKIEEHGNSDAKQWTALAWINERTDPESFALRKEESNGPRVVVQIGVKDSDVQVQIGSVPHLRLFHAMS
jgi:hypothetical protein